MSERVLDSPPSLGGLFARAGLGALPLVTRLPGLGTARTRAHGADGPRLPETVLGLDRVGIDRDRLARYSRVCGFALGDRLPVTFPHILAFPLQLSLMTDPAFPFPAIGLVHIENRLTRHRPISAAEELDLRVWAEDLRPHPRGTQFSLRTEVRTGGELVWEETSVNLRRGGQSDSGEGRGDGAPPERAEPEPDELRQTAVWRLAGDLGRRYGAVAGDLNPIHLHPLSARLFGFPRAIAHGMWTKARCLAALDPQLADHLTVAVRFRRPILLPGKVEFLTGSGEATGAIAFAVQSPGGRETHLEGELSSG